MKENEIRQLLKDNLLKICDNVSEKFVFPDEHASLQSDFPYITITYGLAEFTGVSKLVIQEVHIIGFVKSNDDDLPDLISDLKRDIFFTIYNNENPKLIVTELDQNNIFKPFGLDAGLFPPYGAVRFTIKMPYTMEQN